MSTPERFAGMSDRDALEPTHSVWDFDVIETTDGDWAHRECVKAKVAGAVARHGVFQDEVVEDEDECGLCDGILIETREGRIARLNRAIDDHIDWMDDNMGSADPGERARAWADLRALRDELASVR